jgi:hypothetical protein
MDRKAIARLPDAFPDGSDWTIYSPVDDVMPWRVVILSSDRKREGIGESTVSLAQAYEKAIAAWWATR